MVTKLLLGIVGRMTGLVTLGGALLGGVYGLALVTGSTLELVGFIAGILYGGVPALVIGVVSGIAMAMTTERRRQHVTDPQGYLRTMSILGAIIGFAGYVLLMDTILLSSSTSLYWLGTLMVAVVPGLLSGLVTWWAARRVAGWVVGQVQPRTKVSTAAR